MAASFSMAGTPRCDCLKTFPTANFLPLLCEVEERAGERRRVFIGIPLSSVLSPLVPRGARKKYKQVLRQSPLRRPDIAARCPCQTEIRPVPPRQPFRPRRRTPGGLRRLNRFVSAFRSTLNFQPSTI